MCETNLHRATCIQDPPSPSKKMLEEKKLIMNVDLVKMWIICRIPFLIHRERGRTESSPTLKQNWPKQGMDSDFSVHIYWTTYSFF